MTLRSGGIARFPPLTCCVCLSLCLHSQLRQIRHALQSLAVDAVQTLVQAFIASRMDYWNSTQFSMASPTIFSTTVVDVERRHQVGYEDQSVTPVLRLTLAAFQLGTLTFNHLTPLLPYGYRKHPMHDRVKPSFVIFDILAL